MWEEPRPTVTLTLPCSLKDVAVDDEIYILSGYSYENNGFPEILERKYNNSAETWNAINFGLRKKTPKLGLTHLKIHGDRKIGDRPELIVCAAIKFEIRVSLKERNNKKGFEWVLPMVRHYSPDAHETLSMIDDYYTEREVQQGFITNKGRFVDRKEVLEIAKQNNQIKFDIGELYSEMLY